MTSDPQESLVFANTAAKLGDLAAPALQAHLLDHGGATSCTIMGKDRLHTISQLIAKIDPSYAFNASTSQPLRESGYIRFLTGKNPNQCTVIFFALFLEQWRSFSVAQLKELILLQENSICIICLTKESLKTSCEKCGFQVHLTH